MGDERASSESAAAGVQESDYAAAAAEREAAVESSATPRTSPSQRAGELTDVLRIRWDTPRGRTIRTRVIRDIRFEASAHLGEILAELRGSSDVPGFFDLRYIRLDGENLAHTKLGRCDLTGASLAKTSLVSADLAGARLAKARLVGAALGEADLSRASLDDANLTEASLERATAVSASFVRARAIGASFRGASLVGADFRGAMLVRASFEDADLGGAGVAGAHALAGAFARAAQQPENLNAVQELVIGGAEPTPGGPPPLWVAEIPRLRREEPAREKRPSGRVLPPAVDPMPTPLPGASKSWDAALAALLLQRGRVSRIVAVVDGVEKVVFER